LEKRKVGGHDGKVSKKVSKEVAKNKLQKIKLRKKQLQNKSCNK
jgi:hypothetical protein